MRKEFTIFSIVTTAAIVVIYLFLSNKADEFSVYENTLIVLLLLMAFLPNWYLSIQFIKFLNRKSILTKSFLMRTIRIFILSPILFLLITLFINVVRYFSFNNLDNDPFDPQKIMSGILISASVLFFTDIYLQDENYKQLLLNMERNKNKELILKNKILKNQINPHFLFNSLNVLSSLIFIDAERANVFTKELSKLYRYIVTNAEVDSVNLIDEMEFIKAYCLILSLRFDYQIRVEIHGLAPHGKIIPMALQVLIENAQKHNVFSTENPLDIHIQISENSVFVINNLTPKDIVKTDSTHVGLYYVKEMYKRFNLDISVEKQANSFMVSLPIITNN